MVWWLEGEEMIQHSWMDQGPWAGRDVDDAAWSRAVPGMVGGRSRFERYPYLTMG